MAPTKKSTTAAAAAVADEEPSNADIFKLLKSSSEQLATLTAKMDKVDHIETEVKNIKTLVVSLRDENKELRAAIKEKDSQLADMQVSLNNMETKLNNLEQHHRGWGARVLNVPLSKEDEADPAATIEKVFSLALRPMLEGAVQAGKLREVPSADQVLEVAHVLPGKPGQPKPVIMRFYNRNLRNLCFQFKRDFATRESSGSSGGGTRRSGGGGEEGQRGAERAGRYKYPLYDDLTQANLAKMRAISQDDRVQACWTVNGQIKFKLKDSEVVKKVSSIYDDLDVILK